MQAVVYTGTGGNEVVEVAQRPDPVARGEEVVVAVRFAGLNPADVMQRNGHYPPPPGAPADVPGLEVAGVVASVGERVRNLAPGDRVLGLVAGGGLAQRVAVPESNLCLVPDTLDDVGAAAVPEAFITAHDALRTRADLSPGDLVVVTGASGGVGTAAVQIARICGASVVGTSRTGAGRALIRSLGATACAPDELLATLAASFRGRGVDVVLELVGPGGTAASLDMLATLGRIVVVGIGAGGRAEVDFRRLLGKRASIIGTTLRARPTAEKAAAVARFAHEVLPQLAAGVVRPVVEQVFPLDAVHAALTHVEAASRQGKALLDLGEPG